MKRRLLALAIHLYPRAWRARYGAEFTATLEDMPAPGWAAVWNVLKGALAMQVKYNGASVSRMIVTLGIVGAVLAGLGSLTIPDVYNSRAVVAGTGLNPEALTKSWQRVLAEPKLQSIIEKHRLYPGASSQIAVETMMKDVTVSGLGPVTKEGELFTVSFAYSDATISRNVVTELTQALVEEHGELKVLDSAYLPDGPLYPNRKMFVFTGLLAGALLGALWALIRSTPIARMAAAAGLAGALLAGAASFAIRDVYASSAALTGKVSPETILPTTERALASPRVLALTQKHGLPAPELKKLARVSRVIPRRHGEVAFSVAFLATNNRVAREVTLGLTQAIIDESAGQLSVLDRASLPTQPVYPNRPVIAFIGLLAGAVAGLLWALFRRRPAAPTPALP